MNNPSLHLTAHGTALRVFSAAATLLMLACIAVAGEYTGQFDSNLVVNPEETERVIFKHSTYADRWKEAGDFGSASHYSTAQLMDPVTGQASLLALLVEVEDEDPIIFVDLDNNNRISPNERFAMKNPTNPYLWEATVAIPLKGGFFTSAPIKIEYFNSIRVDKMTEDDRLIRQTSGVLVRGWADVNGKKVVVMYALVDRSKVNPREGWLGIDVDGDGDVDMDNLSPEAAKADNEVVVFRVGSMYLSTKKADVSKNQIVLRDHEAKDYKRLELYMGKAFPEFSFADFDGRKRNISEFRGKYVLLDIWGFWCPPCRKELPYIREAHKRFGNRNLEIIGLNTDPDFTIDSMKKALRDNGMTWTQAKFDSVLDFLKGGLRISSFPTTFLISPDGKILSMSRHERKEPDLRGEDLLETLEKILPK